MKNIKREYGDEQMMKIETKKFSKLIRYKMEISFMKLSNCTTFFFRSFVSYQ